MFCSLTSILITASNYNDEKWDGGRSASKFSLSFFINASGLLFRAFLSSLLFAITPYWTLALTAVLYLIHLVTFKVCGHSWQCLLYSYTSLVFPSGHSKQLGESSNRDFQHVTTSRASMSEVRRARINQVMRFFFFCQRFCTYLMFSGNFAETSSNHFCCI